MKRFTLVLFLLMTVRQYVFSDTLSCEQDYLFTVTHLADHPPVGLPSQSIPDSCYEPVTQALSYHIQFSASLDTVFIDTMRYYGVKVQEDSGVVHFDLISTFGVNGRFVVTVNDSLLQAEYTVYGSGVPVIKSEKGVLAYRPVSVKPEVSRGAGNKKCGNVRPQQTYLLNGRKVYIPAENQYRKPENIYLYK